MRITMDLGLYMRSPFWEHTTDISSGPISDARSTCSSSAINSITLAYDNTGWGNANTFGPNYADGSTVVFHSRASNLLGDENGQSDIFVSQPIIPSLEESLTSPAVKKLMAVFLSDVNEDGSVIVFESVATNLQTNGVATSGRKSLFGIERRKLYELSPVVAGIAAGQQLMTPER